MNRIKTSQPSTRTDTRAPRVLEDGQLDRIAGGARPVSPKPIIIIGG